MQNVQTNQHVGIKLLHDSKQHSWVEEVNQKVA